MSISTWATALLLGGTAALTFAVHTADYRYLLPGCIVLCAVVAAAGIARALPPDQVTIPALFTWSPPALGRLLSQLSPVLFLSAAYPLAVGKLTTAGVAGVPLARLLLATSVTAPWLSQIVCMPLFSQLSPHAADGNPDQMRARALDAWPWSFAAAIPATAVLAVPVGLIGHWPLRAVLAYVALCLLNAAYAQSLAYSVVSRHSILWLAGWAAYALALLAAPRLWFLPPVAGLSVQSAYLIRQVRFSAMRFARPAHISSDLARGAMLGCLLWSDKYLYFLRFPHSFNAVLLFGAMLPAIVSYNFYFALLAPRTDGLVESVRRAMAGAPISRLRTECTVLSGHIRGAAAQAALLCALLSLAAVSFFAVVNPSQRLAGGSEMLASWCFVMGSLACYQLAYLGQARLAYGYGAVHLLLAEVAFAVSPAGPDAYLMLAAVEAILVTLVLRVCMRDWDQPEFMLFWRHAMRW